MSKHLLAGAVFVGLWGCLQGLGWAETPAKFDPNAPDITAINTRLMSGDSNQVTQAVASIRRYFEHKPKEAGTLLQKNWGTALFLARCYEETAAFGHAAILAFAEEGDIVGLEAALAMRSRALIRLGRCAEALEAAKSFYNVCAMGSTSRAVDLVAEALTCARKDEPDIGKRFRMEQSKAASTNSIPEAAAKEPAILQGVKINGEPYKPLIEKLTLNINVPAIQTVLSLATAYLLADQPKMAEDIFEEANAQTYTAYAAEGIARSIRAQDGNVRRANAWVREQAAKAQ